MACNAGPDIIEDGLVLCLDAANINSYPKSGTTWSDRSASGYDGTLQNTPQFYNDNGGYFTFNGADESTNLGDVLDMGYQSMTICAFVKTGASQAGVIIGKHSYRANLGRWYLSITSDGKIRNVVDLGEGGTVLDSITDIRNTGWRMITGVWDRSISRKVYIDDKLESSYTQNSSSTNVQNSDPFRVGSGSSANGSTHFSYFNGSIANVSVYNRALTADEVRQNYLATKERYA